MVGYVTDAVVRSLQAWTGLTDEHIYPVYATGGATEVEDTPIPCVAVCVIGDNGQGNTYIGGEIRFYFELHLMYIVPVVNTTFTEDKGQQAKRLDLSEEIVNCIEQVTRFERAPDVISEVLRTHDLNLQFARMETQTTFARKGMESVLCQVHDVIYSGDTMFDKRHDRDTESVLKRVEVDVNDGEIKTIIE